MRAQYYSVTSRLCKLLVAVLALLCLIQVLVGLSRENQRQLEQNEPEIIRLKHQDSIERAMPKKLDEGVLATALKEMFSLHKILRQIQHEVEIVANYVNSTLIPAKPEVERLLKDAGVSSQSLKDIHTVLERCEKRVNEGGVQILDDVESLVIKVGFILDDLHGNLVNLVPSAYDYLVQFKIEFEQGYRNNKVYIELAFQNVHRKILYVIQGKKGENASRVRSIITEMEEKLKEGKEKIEAARAKYDKIKISAFKALKVATNKR